MQLLPILICPSLLHRPISGRTGLCDIRVSGQACGGGSGVFHDVQTDRKGKFDPAIHETIVSKSKINDNQKYATFQNRTLDYTSFPPYRSLTVDTSCIMFRLAVLVYRCLHGLAPSYLAAELHRVSDVDSRRRLRSASSVALIVRPTLRSSIGNRSFPVAAARTWNSLPPCICNCISISTDVSKEIEN